METEMTTNTTDTTTETTTTVEPLDVMVAEAERLHNAVKEAQIAYEMQLRAIGAAHGKTYKHNGGFYQIRVRDDSTQGRSIAYVCALPAEPKTWLKGRKKKEKPAAAAPVVETVSETGEATVIE